MKAHPFVKILCSATCKEPLENPIILAKYNVLERVMGIEPTALSLGS